MKTDNKTAPAPVCAGRERFVLHDGPPYANGHVHYLALRHPRFLAELRRLRTLSTPRSGRLGWSASAVEFAVMRLVSGLLAGLVCYGVYRMFML